MSRRTLTVIGMFGLAVLAAGFPAIAIFSSLALLIGGLTLSRPYKAPLVAALVVMTALNGFAMFQFVIQMAVSGVVAGGERALTRNAVSALRKIVFAQDIARQRGMIDPDQDGIGSALTLRGLVTGKLRQGDAVPPLLLRFGLVQAGDHGDVIAEREGYLFALHIPQSANRIDEEAAERRYVAYAWPKRFGQNTEVVYVDEHERVFVSDNQGVNQKYAGLDHPPPPEAALTGPGLKLPPGLTGHDGGTWQAWKGKRARKNVVGDTAAGRSKSPH